MLRDLVPFVQFKKREKHPWRSATFSKVPGYFTKSNTPPWEFFMFFFLNCTNGTKPRNAPQIHPVDKYKTVLETEMNQRAKINQILRADNHLIVNNPKL